jgi:hypothetical protein
MKRLFTVKMNGLKPNLDRRLHVIFSAALSKLGGQISGHKIMKVYQNDACGSV